MFGNIHLVIYNRSKFETKSGTERSTTLMSVKKLVILFGAMVCFGTVIQAAQQKPASGAKPPAAKSPASKQTPNPQPRAQSNDLLGDSNGRPQGPTEITATQEAQFDTKTRSGVFIGNVKVVDPQFTLTSNRLTVHLNKDEDGGGLNEAEAQGNVVIVHINQPKTPAQTRQPRLSPLQPGATVPPTPAPTPAPAQTAHDLSRQGRECSLPGQRWFDYLNRVATSHPGP